MMSNSKRDNNTRPHCQPAQLQVELGQLKAKLFDLMEDHRKGHFGDYTQQAQPPTAAAKPFSGIASGGGHLPKYQQNHQMYTPNQRSKLAPQPKHSADDLTPGFSGMSLQGPNFGNAARPSPQISAHSTSVSGGVALNNPMPYMYNGSVNFPAGMYPHQPQGSLQYQPGNQLYQHGSYYGYPAAAFPEYSPNANWIPQSRVSSGDVPSLVGPRRGSSSSNENDLPGTPFTHYTGYGSGGGVTIMNDSPNSMYAYSTPSPIGGRFNQYKQPPIPQIPVNLQLLCQQDPPIPRAVPAPYSPQKPLEQRLVNKHGITNVYIRGLQPDTTDELLYKLASRFGEIDSSKAILDHDNGECKGFGFVKYFSFKDAENCIRAFTWCGYETSFARESFYSQLKKLSEPSNTNLYISNLPKNLNEHELASIFNGYKVQSARILRNGDGSGRGVGFARFESREVCEAVIRDFNNTPVSKPESGEHIIQIRYADTPEQKALKQTTTAARQYRTAEYESQTKPTGLETFKQVYETQNGYVQNQVPTMNVQGRLSALTAHLSPASTGTQVQVKIPRHQGSTSGSDSVDGGEPTLKASITNSHSHDHSIKVEAAA